eukprot:5337288-Amphidinium_carterae.1
MMQVGGKNSSIAAVAGAVAAAEALADRMRARLMPPEQPFVMLRGAGEVLMQHILLRGDSVMDHSHP